MYVDFGAELLLAADKSGIKIAVEVKSFTGPSVLTDLERALGQFVLYQDVLARTEPDRSLYLAVRNVVFDDFFDEPLGRLLLENKRIKLIVFDLESEVISQWIQ